MEKWPFLLIGGLALGVTLAVSAWRWTRAPLAYRVDSLKGCLGETYREAAETYYHHGRLDATVVASHCLAGPRAELDISVGMDGAAPKITAAETPASDFFGNGKGGDEGLELGTSGRFRAITP